MVSLHQTAAFQIVYEDPRTGRNLIACDRWAGPGRPLHDRWCHHNLLAYEPQVAINGLDDRPERYVFPFGLFHHPEDWTNGSGPLSYVPEQVKEDAKQGRVLFIFDQAQEGNADSDLWRWFYAHCHEHGISPACVLYLTSDHFAEERHSAWCEDNAQHEKIHVINSLFNMYMLTTPLRHRGFTPTIDIAAGKTHLYNCLNRVLRKHRIWFWLRLHEAGLLGDGLVSMDRFSDPVPMPDSRKFTTASLEASQRELPMIVDNTDFNINLYHDVNQSIYDRTWFTVVTETYVDDAQMLIGEKVFKPMLCGSPFLLLSTAGTLDRLRALGFKTFPMLWDESYDQLPISARIDAIIDQMRSIQRKVDRVSWFESAGDVLLHNQQLAWTSWSEAADWRRILAIWREFTLKL